MTNTLRSILTLLVALLVLPTLAEAGKQKRMEEPPEPQRPEIAAEASTDASGSPGSLWSEVQARQLMGMDSRQVGDLITVLVSESSTTTLDAGTSTSKESSIEASIISLLGAEQTLQAAHPNLANGISIGGGSSAAFNGAGQTSRDADLQAVLTCSIIEVLANGNLRVWGFKKVRVNRETQYVVIEGIARPRDIRMDNTVPSELLAEASIEVTGSGVVADRQGPGWGARVLDFLWPF